MRILLWLALLAITSATAPAAAAEQRERIGLVLGGGGAKGAAHIGVLQVLDELRVPVDCIVGTSVGALVGGSFASGATPEEVKDSILGINWQSTVGNAGVRDQTPINTKLGQRAYSNGLELGFKQWRPVVPDGLIGSQRIEDVIRSLVEDARYVQDFSELPIPFAAVATDLVSGEMVVMTDGDLSVAMRASMAVPGAFSPVRQGERVLADGGLVRNLPVDVARELCADTVIAVWFESPEVTADELGSAFALANRSLDIMIVANEREQLATLAGNDVEVAVAIGDISTSDFLRSDEAVEIGYQAASAQREALRSLAVSEAEYAAWRGERLRVTSRRGVLADIRISGLERVNPDYVLGRFEDLGIGETIPRGAIPTDLGRVFALGDFERIDYRLVGPTEARVLEIEPIEKSWGPHFLYFDYGLATHGDGDIGAIVRADHRRTWLNRFGGQWHNVIQLGRNTEVATGWYQPINVQQTVFVEPKLSFTETLENLYVGDDRIARYFFRETYAQLDAGMNFGSTAELRSGIQYGRYSVDLDTGTPGLPQLSGIRDTNAFARLTLDTRNDQALPTRGTFLSMSYRRSLNTFRSEDDYEVVKALLTQSFRLARDSVSVVLGGGDTLSGSLPPPHQFRLGGIRTFPGLRPGELRGERYWYGSAIYLKRLTDLQPLFGQSLYASLRLSAGDFDRRFDGLDEGTLYGVAGSLIGNTPLGPFLLSLGWVDNGAFELQFSLGRPIREGSLIDDTQ